jgi:hypothetical protein
VFISHAGEQKWNIVATIRRKFKDHYPLLNVFVDEFSLVPDDDGWAEIQKVLQKALVGGSAVCQLTTADNASMLIHGAMLDLVWT